MRKIGDLGVRVLRRLVHHYVKRESMSIFRSLTEKNLRMTAMKVQTGESSLEMMPTYDEAVTTPEFRVEVLSLPQVRWGPCASR